MKLFKCNSGGIYEYLGEAFHTRTGTILVLYREVDKEDAIVFARPKEEFFGELQDGRKRFTETKIRRKNENSQQIVEDES